MKIHLKSGEAIKNVKRIEPVFDKNMAGCHYTIPPKRKEQLRVEEISEILLIEK